MQDDTFDLFHYDAVCRQYGCSCDGHIRTFTVPAGIRHECDLCGRARLISSTSASS